LFYTMTSVSLYSFVYIESIFYAKFELLCCKTLYPSSWLFLLHSSKAELL
jgi:hypothetical protein